MFKIVNYTSSLCIVSAIWITTVYGCMMRNKTFCLMIKIFWSSCSVRKQRPSLYRPVVSEYTRTVCTSTVYIFKQNKLFEIWTNLSFLARFFSHQIKQEDFKNIFLCPFAVYYLRYAVRSFFTISRRRQKSGIK